MYMNVQEAIWNWILVIFSYSIIDLILKRRESMIDKISIDLIDSLLKEKKKKKKSCASFPDLNHESNLTIRQGKIDNPSGRSTEEVIPWYFYSPI